MTGYASAQQGAAQPGATGALGLEIRAVNGRFLDLTLRLPEELRAHEPALRECLTRGLRRGKVELRGWIDAGASTPVSVPGSALLQQLNAAQDAVRAWLPQAAPLSVADVLHLTQPTRALAADAGATLLQLCEQVLQGLLEARAREGGRLVAMLLDRVASLRALAQQAQPMVPQLVAQQRQRFLERWREALDASEGVSSDTAQDRALAEATAFALRIDVAEELTRLQAHLDETERLLHKGGEVGKRLDFLIQELHREANTLGSKSAALDLTHVAIDMKVLIEQMREQVQNLE
jgi:uncharacterized protein (TIGR00255 family)